jgi:hypothetical protein
MSAPETQVTQATNFPTLLRITRGQFTDVDALLSALREAGIKVSEYAESMMRHERFVFSAEQTEMDIVVVTPDALGFVENPTLQQIINRGTEQGLIKLTGEDAVLARLAYLEQPNGQWLLTAMDTIPDSHGGLSVFDVERSNDGERWLSTDWVDSDDTFRLDEEFSFGRSK